MTDTNLRSLCWQMTPQETTITHMDTAPRLDDSARHEDPADRQRRFAHEAALLAEAQADIVAGRLVDAAEVDAWIDSIGTDRERRPPFSRR